MKRLTALLLSLILALSLCACGVKPAENTENQDLANQPAITFDVDPNYQYGNRQKQHSGNFYRFGDEVVFSYNNGTRTRLYGYDLETGEIRRYCPDPACDHKPCQSGIPYHYLEVYDGKLYGITSYRPARLKAVDGTQVQTVTNEKVTYSLHHDGKLYLMIEDRYLGVLEAGQDKPRVIIENGFIDRGAAFGPYLYVSLSYYNDNIVRIDLTADAPTQEVIVPDAAGMADGQHIYYVDSKTNQLFRCNMDGSNPQLLVAQQVLPVSINFDGDYFYYRLATPIIDQGADAYDIYRFPKSDPSKIERIVTLDVPVHQVYTVPGTGKLFVKVCNSSTDKDSDIYVMETDGSNPTRLVIPE